jgi:hypothetical protein
MSCIALVFKIFISVHFGLIILPTVFAAIQPVHNFITVIDIHILNALIFLYFMVSLIFDCGDVCVTLNFLCSILLPFSTLVVVVHHILTMWVSAGILVLICRLPQVSHLVSHTVLAILAPAPAPCSRYLQVFLPVECWYTGCQFLG